MVLKIIVCVTMTGAGLVFLVRAFLARQKTKIAQSWPTASGKIMESTVEEDSNRSATGKVEIAYLPIIKYEFRAGGKIYIGDRVVFGHPHFDYLTACNIRDRFVVNSEIPVYYNPVNPSEAVLSPKSTVGMLSWIPGAFFIVAAILIGIISFLPA
ncbi:MAG: DUF3592 domain-containing protein [Chloroflexi bacterium]|nr:DUF3592 domain-containing protein [Chloroflexota bacterium]